MTDYIKKNIDFANFIPERLRNKLNVSLARNLFNKFTTKEESLPLYGFVGRKGQNSTDSRPFIPQKTFERKVNALSPMIVAEHGSDTYVFTMKEILDKAELIGIDTKALNIWGSTQMFNFAPPIDLDKFCNFSEYYWVANAIPTPPSMSWNPTKNPEYYVIAVDTLGTGTNDWQRSNWWVHKDDLSTITGLDYSKITKAFRPIIEYFKDVELNGSISAGMPCAPGTGTNYNQEKTQFNQLPLFNIYTLSGKHSGKVGALFYYKESQDASTDKYIQRRIVHDVNGDYVFSQGLVVDDKMFCYKQSSVLKTIWEPGSSAPSSTVPDYIGVGAGSMQILGVMPFAPAEIWKVVAKNNTEFTVTGTKSGIKADALANIIYNNGQVIFLITGSGFVQGDAFEFRTFNVEVPRYVVAAGDEYVNYDGDPHADSQNTGAWAVPTQFKSNPLRENRRDVIHGDLIGHFRSIMSQQVGFIGSSSGPNNFRNLTSQNYGLGGTIKETRDAFLLFVSMMIQEELTPISILDFAESAYLQSLNGITEYVSRDILGYLTEHGNPTPLSGIDATYPKIEELYSAYVSTLKTRTDLLTTYYDTTSPIPNWCVTLPQIGLASAVAPKISFDNEVGVDVIVHHDGHVTPLSNLDAEIKRSLTKQEVTRYNGTKSTGIFSSTIPTMPIHKNQLWFNSITGELSIFDVQHELSSSPIGPAVGDLWIDTSSSQVKRWTGLVWIQIDPNTVWTTIDLSSIHNSLILNIEKKLYEGVPSYTQITVDPFASIFVNAYNYVDTQLFELAKFAAKYKYDTFASIYEPTDAFTWNYKFASSSLFDSTKLSVLGAVPARWFDIYKLHFDRPTIVPGEEVTYPDRIAESLPTCRPNIEPWKLLGYAVKPALWDIGMNSGHLFKSSVPSRMWTTDMWTWIKSQRNFKLCVNPDTDELLPPYVSSSKTYSTEALTTVIPAGINQIYSFGDNGPIELVWKKSLEYRYSQIRSAFKIQPISVIEKSWGIVTQTVNGLPIDILEQRTISNTTLKFHGEAISPVQRDATDIISGTVDTTVGQSIFRVVNLLPSGAVFDVITNGVKTGSIVANAAPVTFGALTDVSITDNGTSFSIGDLLTVSTSSITFTPTSFRFFNGFAQLFTNALRYNSVDTQISLSKVLLREWDIKLGYRAGGLIKTDNLTAETSRFVIPDSSMRPIIKKNAFNSNSWVDALRIEVLSKGTFKLDQFGNKIPYLDRPQKDPANPVNYDDWIFRIEHYNPRRPLLDVRNVDLTSTPQTFYALNKEHSSDTWLTYKTLSNEVSYVMPLTITGIQNVINLLVGYSARLEADGWRFTNDDEPNIDSVTGRTKNWQLEIEKFIDSVYSGIEEGQGYILNPFMKNVWVEPTYGLVSEFNKVKFGESLTSPAAYDLLNISIPLDQLTIVRSDSDTQISSLIPMFSVHSVIDEFEHVIIFENYANPSTKTHLIYDPFIGSHVSRILFNGTRQMVDSMRPSFGGYVLNGHDMTKNIMSTIDDMGDYYSTNIDSYDTKTRAALALLGFNKKDYFDLLGSSINSQVNFWRGLIQHKGTNVTIDAFLNSNKFKHALIDEYWAYKIAEYGDARVKSFPEIKINPVDTRQKFTTLQFSDPGLVTIPGAVFIDDLDEDRWFTLDDIGAQHYFEMESYGVVNTNTTANALIELPFVADAIFEVPPFTVTSGTGTIKIDPIEITSASSLNSWKIQFTSASTFNVTVNNVLVGTGTLGEAFEHGGVRFTVASNGSFSNASTITFSTTVKKINSRVVKGLTTSSTTIFGYGPAKPKFNPLKLLDYKSKSQVADITIWHPLVGLHNQEALDGVNIIGDVDYARYNYSTMTVGNETFDPLRAWNKNDVGKIWWDTSKAKFIPYTDYVDYEEILSRWGSLADNGSIDVYEWIESSVPPTEFSTLVKAQEGNNEVDALIRASGKAAKKEIYSRERQWSARPVAWSFTDIPGTPPHPVFNSSYFSKLFVGSTSIGATVITLNIGQFSDYGISSGHIISAWKDSKPFGEMTVGNSLGYKVGSETNVDVPNFVSLSNFGGITASKSDKTVTFASSLGALTLSNELDSGVYYVRATVNGSGLTQRLAVSDFINVIGSTLTLDFDQVGLTITAIANVSPIPASSVAAEIGNISHDLFMRETVDVDISIQFPHSTLSNDPSDGLDYGWKAYSVPTQEQLDADLKSPNNSWEPIFGDYVIVSQPSASFIGKVKEYNSAKLTTLDGVTVERFYTTWANWEKLNDEEQQFIFSSSNTITFAENIDSARLSVYKNGLLVSPKLYSISGKTVTISGLVEGDDVYALHRKYQPTSTELGFNPDESDDPTVQIQYKEDYQYTKVEEWVDGTLVGTKYYFWVYDKNTAAKGKNLSVQQIKNMLKNGPDVFATFQSPIKATTTLKNRYATVAISGLGVYVTEDDRYKIRFTENFTLRDDPEDLNLKNVHSEWILIRKGQTTKIPVELWTKIIDTICGKDSIGNPVPSVNRVDYDLRHGTTTRYGTEKDQALADKDIVISSILHSILNTQIEKNNGFGDMVPDFIEILDFNNSDSWFATPDSSRETMENIWNNAKPTQVNEIFFNVLEDALAQNFELSGLFKTSRLSAYSVRIIEQAIPSDYDVI